MSVVRAEDVPNKPQQCKQCANYNCSGQSGARFVFSGQVSISGICAKYTPLQNRIPKSKGGIFSFPIQKSQNRAAPAAGFKKLKWFKQVHYMVD